MLSIDVLEVIEAQGLFTDLASADEYCHKNVIAPQIRKQQNRCRAGVRVALANSSRKGDVVILVFKAMACKK